jgi:hypothetical protein
MTWVNNSVNIRSLLYIYLCLHTYVSYVGIYTLTLLMATNKTLNIFINVTLQDSWTNQTTLCYAHLHKMKAVQVFFFFYLLCPVALKILLLSLLTWEYGWVDYMTDEFIFILALVHFLCEYIIVFVAIGVL